MEEMNPDTVQKQCKVCGEAFGVNERLAKVRTTCSKACLTRRMEEADDIERA